MPLSKPAPTAASKRLLPWLIAVAFFMESLDTTILNTAVPTIAQALGVAPLSMKSVLASYTLSLAVFIPVSGWVANRFGTRRVFASAIGLFTTGSLLCGLSTSIHMLVAFRILQGLGGAMMVPVGRLTMVRTFAKSELIRAMSFVAVPASPCCRTCSKCSASMAWAAPQSSRCSPSPRVCWRATVCTPRTPAVRCCAWCYSRSARSAQPSAAISSRA